MHYEMKAIEYGCSDKRQQDCCGDESKSSDPVEAQFR
jgi:hypothetical protein